MAELVITDSEDFFEANKDQDSILISGIFFKMIKKSSHLSEVEVFSINESFMQRRLLHGEELLKDLASIAKNIKSYTFPYSAKTKDNKIGITHILIKEFLEKKYFIITLLNLLLEARKYQSVRLYLLESYSLFIESYVQEISIKREFYKDVERRKRIKDQRVKNVIYFLFDLKRYFKKRSQHSEKKRIVFLIQTAEHHHELLTQVYSMCKVSDDIEPVVVYYPMILGDNVKFRRHIPKGILTLPIQEFRGRPKHKIPTNIFDIDLDNSIMDSQSADANYTMMNNMVQELKPSLCLTVGYQDTGRYLSDVCRTMNIPSVSVDYSFITDDYTFDKSVEYDYKCTISESQKKVWQKRKDPSHQIIPVGYLKYDVLKETYSERGDFLNSNGFNAEQKTLFFASSHGYDPQVKGKIMSDLSDFCTSYKFNLIVKTHPLENDGIAQEIVTQENQRVFNHSELSAMECVFYSDVVISQGSSIVLDALFYNKPFITFSYSKDLVITDFMPISKEPFVFKAASIDQLASIVAMMFNSESEPQYQSQMKEVRNQYLYLTDGNASKRVFQKIREIVV